MLLDPRPLNANDGQRQKSRSLYRSYSIPKYWYTERFCVPSIRVEFSFSKYIVKPVHHYINCLWRTRLVPCPSTLMSPWPKTCISRSFRSETNFSLWDPSVLKVNKKHPEESWRLYDYIGHLEVRSSSRGTVPKMYILVYWLKCHVWRRGGAEVESRVVFESWP